MFLKIRGSTAGPWCMFYHSIYCFLFLSETVLWTGYCGVHILCAYTPLEGTKLCLEACGSHDLDLHRPLNCNPLHHIHEGANLWKCRVL